MQTGSTERRGAGASFNGGNQSGNPKPPRAKQVGAGHYDVRFGSKADMAKQSGAMSALPLKADIVLRMKTGPFAPCKGGNERHRYKAVCAVRSNRPCQKLNTPKSALASTA